MTFVALDYSPQNWSFVRFDSRQLLASGILCCCVSLSVYINIEKKKKRHVVYTSSVG